MFAPIARFRRFSLASLLLVVTLISLYLGREWQKVEERRSLLAWVEEHDLRSGQNRMWQVSVPPDAPRPWVQSLLEQPSFQTRWKSGDEAIVFGCTSEDIARLQRAFPEIKVVELTSSQPQSAERAPLAADEIAMIDKMTAAEINQSRVALAQRSWDELQQIYYENEAVKYIDMYDTSCWLRDAELALANSRESRVAARQKHAQRLQKHYLQRNALYTVGSRGGDAYIELQSHLGWLEAVLELRAEEGRTDPAAENNSQASTKPGDYHITDATAEIARSETMTTLELHQSQLAIADCLWDVLHTNHGGPPPYDDRDRFNGSIALRDTALILSAGPADRIAARRIHMERMERPYRRRNELHVVGARGGEAHAEAEAHLRWLDAARQLRDEEARATSSSFIKP